LIASLTASPKSPPKRANSAPPDNEQRLAGYVGSPDKQLLPRNSPETASWGAWTRVQPTWLPPEPLPTSSPNNHEKTQIFGRRSPRFYVLVCEHTVQASLLHHKAGPEPDPQALLGPCSPVQGSEGTWICRNGCT
jgi:hypothetical protein